MPCNVVAALCHTCWQQQINGPHGTLLLLLFLQVHLWGAIRAVLDVHSECTSNTCISAYILIAAAAAAAPAGTCLLCSGSTLPG
jgi:hypothetical protein